MIGTQGKSESKALSWGQDTASPFVVENDKLMGVKSRHSK